MSINRNVLFLVFALMISGCASDYGPLTDKDTVNASDRNIGRPELPYDSGNIDISHEFQKDNGSSDRNIGFVDTGHDTGIKDVYHDPCKPISCSYHGQCVVKNGAPYCDCFQGYRQNGLDCVKIPSGKAKILFDAGHGVTSGNADWRIDDDSPRPGPATPHKETDWSGAISKWAFELFRTGNYEIYNSKHSFSITYGGSSQLDLKNFNIFVSCEPNHPYSTSEKRALINFVKNGGRFILVIDHKGSDRDNDGWDSPKIAHDLFTDNGVQTNPFGMTIPEADGVYGENVSGKFKTVNTNSPVINGPFGKVRQFNFHRGSYFSIDTSKGVQALVWQGYSKGSTHVAAAVVKYGKGWFALIGDSSPEDDGTGNSHDNLFDGWGEADDGAFVLNLTDFMRIQ